MCVGVSVWLGWSCIHVAGFSFSFRISPPPLFDPRTVQPVASHYTNWAISVHIERVAVRNMMTNLLFSRKAVKLLPQLKPVRFSDRFRLNEVFLVTTLLKLCYVVSKCNFTERKVMQQNFRIWFKDAIFRIVTAFGVRKTEESCLDSLQGQDLFHFCNVSWPILGPKNPPVQ